MTEPNPAPNGAAAAAEPATSGTQQATPAAATTTAATPGAAAQPAGSGAPAEPPLTNAQLKAKAKAEKAARRAKEKEVKAAVPAGPAGGSGGASQGAKGGGDAKGNKGNKGKQDAGQGGAPAQGGGPGPQSQGRPGPPRRPSMGGRRPSIAAREGDVRSGIPDCFSHLPMARRIQTSQAHKDVHPAVLALGQQMATFTVRDSIARLEAMLLAFKKVIESYETPKGNSLSRHFVPHYLNAQIEYLTECRPMCFAMGNAIRLLKTHVNKFDIDTPEDEAKDHLQQAIDNFLKERITLAEFVIAKNASEMIEEGDVILTYGRHRLVEKTILQALSEGKEFEVSVIDDPYDPTGQALAKTLRNEGVRVYYAPHLGALATHVKRATKVFVGAEAIFANGALLASAGSSDIAVAAKDASVPVIALCETINFDRDRIATDSLTYNEIDPERHSADSFRLLFDTTTVRFIDVVVTEYESETGNAPAQTVLSILRMQEDPSVS